MGGSLCLRCADVGVWVCRCGCGCGCECQNVCVFTFARHGVHNKLFHLHSPPLNLPPTYFPRWLLMQHSPMCPPCPPTHSFALCSLVPYYATKPPKPSSMPIVFVQHRCLGAWISVISNSFYGVRLCWGMRCLRSWWMHAGNE